MQQRLCITTLGIRMLAIGGAAGIVVALAALPAAADEGGGSRTPPSFPVVASGLDNPRGLTFGPDGDLFVAEAGHGGEGPCIPSDDDPSVDTCFGTSGAITRVHGGSASQVVTGLPSLAPQVATQGGTVPPGAQGVGPSDVAVTADGNLVFTVGLGSNPSNRDEKFVPTSGVGKLLGTLVGSSIPGTAADSRIVADIAAFEGTNDPVKGQNGPDSNANAVIVDGSGFMVIDAGGNDMLGVDASGAVSVGATFPATKRCPPPPISPEAVPTSVTRGPDGALYVGELTGFPFCKGGASIYKVVNGKPTVYAAGLTNVTGVAFGPDGTLYAVELAADGLQKGPIGAVVAIPPGGGASMSDYSVLAAGLMAPYGIAVRDGSAYVTIGAILPATAGGGSVVKIPLTAPAPTSTVSSSETTTRSGNPSSSAAAQAASTTPPSQSTSFALLPGATGDVAAPATGFTLWIVGCGVIVVGCAGVFVVARRRRRGVDGRHL